MTKLLFQEKDRLERTVKELVCENGFMRLRLRNIDPPRTRIHTKARRERSMDLNDVDSIVDIAQQTLAEFMNKATGTIIEWIRIPGVKVPDEGILAYVKPGPDSDEMIGIPRCCNGVAARACTVVNLEPSKIVDILKDRPTWLPYCRSLEIFNVIQTMNGGTIELVHMQTYAPTTLTPSLDFWTMRYTTKLDDGGLVVCERTVSGSGFGPIPSTTSHCTKVEMLPSGYLIQPCEEGGSIVHIVDHLNLEAWSGPEVLRPLYQSSKFIAEEMTIRALCYIGQIAQELSGEVVSNDGNHPAARRDACQRLSRGFNDAVNGFSNDGWSWMNDDGSQDLVLAVNSSKHFGFPASAFSSPCGVLCVKTSMVLQDVSPAWLVRYLRDHRSEWADFEIDAYIAASLNVLISGMRGISFSGAPITKPLGQALKQEEFVEVIELEGQAVSQDETVVPSYIHLLQICSGMDENVMTASSELIFSHIHESLPQDVSLMSSGFRIIQLDSKTDASMSHPTLDPTSNFQVACNMRSVLTIAFQFPFELHVQDAVATMGKQYVRNVICFIQRLVTKATSGQGPDMGLRLSPGSPDALTLAHWICQSYRYHFGEELLNSDNNAGLSVLTILWNHRDPILCFSLTSGPVFTFANLVFTFANQAGLGMLGTTLMALPGVTLDTIFDEAEQDSLGPYFSKTMEGVVHKDIPTPL